MPEIEVVVDEPLVRRLLAALPASLAGLGREPLTPVAAGWDNAVWRVGPAHAVRVPVRALAAPLVEIEARWVDEMSEPLRRHGIRVPRPVHLGPASADHPWPWLLVEWVPGRIVSEVQAREREPLVTALARALPALHRPAPSDAPVSPYRGVPLAARRALTDRHADEARAHLGDETVRGLLALVDAAEAAPPWPGAAVWCHGDLHAGNLTLSDAGRLGVLDFGDLTRGDPAVDLRVLWVVLDAAQREVCRATIEASGAAYDPHVWRRAKGWAAGFALALAADEQGRGDLAAIRHTVAQLGL